MIIHDFLVAFAWQVYRDNVELRARLAEEQSVTESLKQANAEKDAVIKFLIADECEWQRSLRELDASDTKVH